MVSILPASSGIDDSVVVTVFARCLVVIESYEPKPLVPEPSFSAVQTLGLPRVDAPRTPGNHDPTVAATQLSLSTKAPMLGGRCFNTPQGC